MTRADHVVVAGKTFRYGTVNQEMRLEAKRHIDFLVNTVKIGWPLGSWPALLAAAQIGVIFFREHAPDVDSDWLAKNMTAREWEIVALEFTRRALDNLADDYVAGGMS